MSRDSNADPNINLENGGIAPADTEAILGQLDDIRASVVRDLEGAFDALGSIEATMPRVRDQRVHSRFFAVRAHALNYATRYTEAEAAGRTAVRHAEAVSDEVEAARAWMTLVHAQAKLGNLSDALLSALAAERSFTAAGRVDLAVQALSNAAIVTRMSGDGHRAIEMFERALTMGEHDPATRAQIESGLAEALLDIGRFSEAERAFTSSAETFESIGITRAAAIVRGNLADLFGRQGRLAGAIEQFEVARRFFEADEATGELGRILTEQADVYAATGLADEAIKGYRRAGELLERAGAVQEQARALTGLGRLLGGYDAPQASEALDRAARLFEAAGNAAGGALARLHLASLHFSTGAIVEAENALAAAAQKLEGRDADMFLCDLLAAAIHASRGRLEEADRILSVNLERATELGLPILRAEAFGRRARIHHRAGRLDEAIRDGRSAVECIERLRGTLQASRFRAGLLGENRSMYELLIELLLESGSTAEAFEMSERARGRTLLELVGEPDELEFAEFPEAAPEGAMIRELAEARAELNAVFTSHDPTTGRSQRDNWIARVRDAENRVSALETRLHASSRGREMLGVPEGLARISTHLGSRRALVSYWQNGITAQAFVIRDGALTCTELGSIDAIEQAIHSAMFQIRRGLMRGPARTGEDRRQAACRRALESLHALIWRPIAEQVGDATEMIVVPAGSLHTIPFSALFDGDRYLAESAAISVLPTASLLPVLSQQPEMPGRGVSVLAVPDRIAPEIEAEASLLRDAMPDASVIVGDGATTAVARDHASRAGLLHLACHGAFPPDNPLAAGLKFADRWITVREVLGWRIPGSVVVLSGCETGRSSTDTSEEQYGFGRAFFVAGARGLVVSLWIAHDASTRGLMSEMYRAIAPDAAPSEIHAALVSAQRSQICAGIHPAFWSNFIYLGA